MPSETITDADDASPESAEQWSPSAPGQGIRYRPMLLNAVLSVVTLVVFWTWPQLTGSTRVIATASVIGVSSVWFVMWLAFGSRIRMRLRCMLLAALAGLVLLAVSLLRVHAYTGDLVPILTWRWSSEPHSEEFGVGERPTNDAPIDTTPSPHDSLSFLGRDRSAVVKDVRLFRDWSARPPRLLWRRSIGDDAGFSSFAVVGQVALTQQQSGDQELVVCYDLLTGDVLWTHADPIRFESTIGGIGPRATPSVDQGKVYTMGATGVLNCLDLQTGSRLWTHHVLEENDAVTLRWGIAVSPLVVDDLILVTTGHDDGPAFATLVAYDKQTGDVVWKTGHDASSYSSPTIATLDGKRQILIVNHSSVTAHDPVDGTLLWEHPWSSVSSNTSQPVPISDRQLLLTKGYGNGAQLWEIGKTGEDWRVKELWHEPRLLRTKATSTVVRDGYAYGLSDGLLECVDIAAHTRRWKERGFGHGQVLLVDDLLLVQAESGDVVLVEAAPARFVEVARLPALSSRTWNYPVLAGAYLLARNEQEIACFELPLATPASRD
ncbi:MAG: PQQ-binding-like beta-propeller repeat protein [Planctomycetota bacterium]|nr:PQQ-binding-like beta-propeller repeat protein [Planctomycetota bacterium]